MSLYLTFYVISLFICSFYLWSCLAHSDALHMRERARLIGLNTNKYILSTPLLYNIYLKLKLKTVLQALIVYFEIIVGFLEGVNDSAPTFYIEQQIDNKNFAFNDQTSIVELSTTTQDQILIIDNQLPTTTQEQIVTIDNQSSDDELENMINESILNTSSLIAPQTNTDYHKITTQELTELASANYVNNILNNLDQTDDINDNNDTNNVSSINSDEETNKENYEDNESENTIKIVSDEESENNESDETVKNENYLIDMKRDIDSSESSDDIDESEESENSVSSNDSNNSNNLDDSTSIASSESEKSEESDHSSHQTQNSNQKPRVKLMRRRFNYDK